MRTNLPITQKAYPLKPEEMLVSVTDTKGRITYCNRAFIQVSGFTKDELLGQSHNIVRHPDMPEEAFRDMWNSIQNGMPWTGLVKNRRKNGDHYWVRANATPIKDGKKIIGYLSVRTIPDAQSVQQAEALYAKMRQEASQNQLHTGLERGKVVDQRPLFRLARRLQPGMVSRLGLLQAVMMISALLVSAYTPFAWTGWVAAVPLVALSTWLIKKWTLDSMMRIRDDALYLAAGDLSHVVSSDAEGPAGELQKALSQLQVNLRAVVGDTRNEVMTVHYATTEIASGNSDLSARTESQASSLEETAASMEEINSTVRNSAIAASEGANLAATAATLAQQSNTAVNAVSVAMDAIADSASRIEEIIQVVEGVAFQTNILALNAAVEAARAGDAGRSFAVVAGEVRALAQRSTQAARQIAQLIHESSERVSSGTTAANDALKRVIETEHTVKKVSEQLEAIRMATGEQQSGISHVNEAITHMDSITQQNAAMVEELASAAQSLHDQMSNVSDSMSLFRLKNTDVSAAQRDAVELRKVAKAH